MSLPPVQELEKRHCWRGVPGTSLAASALIAMAKHHPPAPAIPMRLQQPPGVPDAPPGDPTPSPAPIPPGFPTDPGPEPAYPDVPSEAPPWSPGEVPQDPEPMPSPPPMEIPP